MCAVVTFVFKTYFYATWLTPVQHRFSFTYGAVWWLLHNTCIVIMIVIRWRRVAECHSTQWSHWQSAVRRWFNWFYTSTVSISMPWSLTCRYICSQGVSSLIICMYISTHVHVIFSMMLLFWYSSLTVFTALHVMQTRYSDENSVHPSICPSVTRVYCDKTEEKSVQIFIPYKT